MAAKKSIASKSDTQPTMKVEVEEEVATTPEETTSQEEQLAAEPASMPEAPKLPPVEPVEVATPSPTQVAATPPHLTPLTSPIDTTTHTLEGSTTESKKPSSKLYVIGLIIIILILGAGGVIYYFQTQNTSNSQESTSTVVEPSVAPFPTPEATMEPLSKEEISLEILNGTKTSGLASKTAKVFKELGYTIDNTGNANDDATENMLYVQKDQEQLLANLLQDVKDELDIATISGYLDDTDQVTARIILGE